MRPHIVFINASLGGPTGNTAVILAQLHKLLTPHATLTVITLAGGTTFAQAQPALETAHAFLFGTGTHWDSWSSHLQRFLEEATPTEGTSLWLGKPAACLITEHSVGGKSVLSRLQGVLSTFGCTPPPMSGLVLSRAAHLAHQHAPADATDFWSTADLPIIAHNLLAATTGTRDWQTWPVDRADFSARWI